MHADFWLVQEYDHCSVYIFIELSIFFICEKGNYDSFQDWLNIAKLSSSWPVPVKSNLNWDLHYIW